MQSLSGGVFNLEYKRKITNFIEELLIIKQQEFIKVNSWDKNLSDKLLTFMSQGKMIRGSLVLFMFEAFGGTINTDAIRVASAMELFHSSLLIHDDIMDNDIIRRGQQTIFAQYQSLGEKEGFIQSKHFGVSMGICAGDIGFFLGFQLLSTIEDNFSKQEIIGLCMKEMLSVGLAQMQDVYAGYAKDEVPKEDIEKAYLYKTGRYTFSLPMMLGAILAGQTKETIKTLEKLGGDVGLLFQLKDDELSLFGSQKDTGKPEGSDIRENKKTLYRYYLFEKAADDEKKKLETIFGNENVSNSDLRYVRQLVNQLQIQVLIDRRMKSLHNNAKEIIMTLNLDEQYKQQLLQLLMFISERRN